MPTTASSKSTFRLGFVPLVDAAPLIVAREKEFFARRGLSISLSREVGWATLRDKLIFGEIDGAHALSGMLVATQLGLGCSACDVMTACVLSLHGNAITLSQKLWDAGVRDAVSLREYARRRQSRPKITFGVVFPWSSHHMQLRDWLRAGGLDLDQDVRVVIVPPAQMVRNLTAGTIDGFCSGEPWNSHAVAQGSGVITAWSANQDPGHIEKVLMVRSSFAAAHAGAHFAMIAALHEACAWCDAPANREELTQLLARPEYLNVSPSAITPALSGTIDCGGGRRVDVRDFITFHRGEANTPTHARASTLLRRMVQHNLAPAAAAHDAQLAHRLFRQDLFKHALTIPTHEIQTA